MSISSSSRQLNPQAFAPKVINSCLVVEGDSISEGFPSVPDRWEAVLLADPRFSGIVSSYNVASGGSELGHVVARYAASVLPHSPSNEGVRTSYLSVEIGSNDIRTGALNGGTVNSWFATLLGYIDTAIDDGFSVIVWTIAPATDFDATETAVLTSINALIRSIDREVALMDFAALLPDPANLTWYGDGIHPTIAGQRYMGWAVGNILADFSQFSEGLAGASEALSLLFNGDITRTGDLTQSGFFRSIAAYLPSSGASGSYLSDPENSGLAMVRAANPADWRIYDQVINGGTGGINFRLVNDAYNSATNYLAVERVGITVINVIIPQLAVTGALRLDTAIASGSQTLNNTSPYAQIYTGAGGHTWTLPAIAGNTDLTFVIKNRGSGSLTVASASGSQIYDTAAQVSISVAAGAAVTLINDGTYYNVI